MNASLRLDVKDPSGSLTTGIHTWVHPSNTHSIFTALSTPIDIAEHTVWVEDDGSRDPWVDGLGYTVTLTFTNKDCGEE
jgi:hypothetical protein